jgi:hypothetical protein
MEESPRLTVFGATVLQLMARRGISRWSCLVEVLRRGGYEFKASRISNWAYGRHSVDRHFGQALAEVLQLTEEEETQLARAYLFGQVGPVK